MLVVGAVVFLDTMFYAVITPLLPQLTHELRLSKLSAGVMTAGYPIGMLVASLPGGILAARVGPRLTVMLGLLLLACSTVAFGLVQSAAALDLARVVEGVGGACSWAGGIAWIVAEDAGRSPRRDDRAGRRRRGRRRPVRPGDRSAGELHRTAGAVLRARCARARV